MKSDAELLDQYRDTGDREALDELVATLPGGPPRDRQPRVCGPGCAGPRPGDIPPSDPVRGSGDNDTWRPASSSADGTFAFEALDGQNLTWPMKIRVSHPLFAPQVASPEGAGEAADGIEIVLSSGRALSGVVRTPSGDPVDAAGDPKPEIEATLTLSVGRERRTRTDEHGHYRFGNVAVGPARIRVTDAGGSAPRSITVAFREETAVGDLVVR